MGRIARTSSATILALRRRSDHCRSYKPDSASLFPRKDAVYKKEGGPQSARLYELWGEFYDAGSAGTAAKEPGPFSWPWNWAASVEPASAVIEELQPEANCSIASKKAVPTNAW